MNLRMAVVYLKQREVLDREQIGRCHCPAEVGVVHGRKPASGADGIHVFLQRGRHILPDLRLDEFVHSIAVNMSGTLLKTGGHFFPRKKQKFFGLGGGGIQRGWIGQLVVVGKDQEMVAVVLVPGSYGFRRGVPVAVESVGVKVAFIPALRWSLCRGGRAKERAEQKRGGGRAEQNGGCDAHA